MSVNDYLCQECYHFGFCRLISDRKAEMRKEWEEEARRQLREKGLL